MSEPLPEMRPRTVAGQRVTPMPVADGTIPRTRRQAFGSSFSHMNDFVLDRWKSLADSSETITEGEFRELVGDAPVEFFQGMTRRQAETRLHEFEHQQFDQQFEQHGITQFAGMAAPFLYDPGTVLTLPLGARNIAQMAGAQTLRQFALEGAKGGGKIAMGTLAAETGLQVRQSGGIDPVVAGASAVAPFLLVPAFGALGRGIRSLGKVRDGPGAHAFGKHSGGTLSPEQASRAADELGTGRPPPVRVLSDTPQAPRARLDELFTGYEGGRAQWVRDLSAGRPLARQFARDMGIDPDAPSIRDLVIAMQDRSAQTSRPPLEHTMRVLDAVNQWRAGERDDGLIASLWQEGLLVARRGADDAAGLRLELSETGRMLDEALANPSQAANRELLNAVNRDGMGALDLAGRRRGIDLDPDTNPRAAFNRVAAAEVSDSEIIKAIDSAQLQTADARPRPDAARPTARELNDPQGDNILRPDPDFDEQASRLRAINAGDEADEIRALGESLIESVITCGRGR